MLEFLQINERKTKKISIIILFFSFVFNHATATVTITRATSGTSLIADKAGNSPGAAWTTLGIIRLTEGAVSDMAAGTNVTLTVIAPAGWTFNTAASITATFTAARDITVASISSITATTITAQFTVVGITKSDVLTITGVQIRADDGANVPGTTTLTSGGTAVITGCPAGSNLGNLSQVVGALYRLAITLPGLTYTDGTTLAGSGYTGTVTNQTSGTNFTITRISAVDQFHNIVTTYTGSKTLTYSGPSSALTAPTYITTVNFTSGRSSTTLTTNLKKAETTTITVTDGTVLGMASPSLIVNPAVINKFIVEDTAGGTIGAQTAVTPFSIKISAVDAQNNVLSYGPNVFTGTVNITSTGTLSSGSGTTAALVAGTLTHNISFSNVGNFTVTATRTTGGAQTGTSNSFAVTAGPLSNFLVEAAAGGSIPTQTAGTSFNIKITARDASNNTCSTGPNAFTGTVNITSLGTLSAGSGTTSAFTAGVLSTTAVTISNTGSLTITATRTSGGAQSGTSNSFTVNPGTLSNFLVESSAGGNIGSQVAATSFNIKVTARDANNNTCSSGPNVFTGTVNITSTGTLTAGSGTTGAFTAGVLASRTVNISNTGSFTITATRTSGGVQTGTSNSFSVTSGVLNNFLVEASGGGTIGTQLAGNPFGIKITARDVNNNACVSGPNTFSGTINITSTGTLYSGGGTSGAFSSGILSPNITFAGTGNFTITATKTSGSETGVSNSFAVNNPVPSVSSISNTCVATGGGSFSLTVNGNSFSNSSIVRFNGSNRATTYVSPTQIQGTINALDLLSNGIFNIDVMNPVPGGGTSNTSPITVSSTPIINTQPSVQNICDGSSASFSVSATGLGISYQWNKAGVPLTDGGNISGATTPTLTINPASTGDASSLYTVSIISSCYPDVVSNNTTLTILANTSATNDVSICDGQSYTPPGGSAQTTSGTYVSQYTNSAGCDSVITTNLTVILNSSATANISICAGQSYTPPGGTAQIFAGTYVTHITNAEGCDSTITTNLSVISNSSSTANISICDGQSYTPPGGSAQTNSGIYITQIPNAAGCDSTITTNLNVIPNTSSTANISICDGQSYTPPGGSAQSAAGTYVTLIANAEGCDSTITTNLTVISNTSSTADISICAGQSYTPPGGMAETTSGIYVTHLTNAEGCDSTIITNLYVYINTFGTANISICDGQSYTPPGGSAQTTAGTYITHITNAENCDSTITTNLSIIPNTSSTANISICNGQSYTPPGGTVQFSPGTYVTHISNVAGCDSTITTNLTVIPNTSSTANISICAGQSYTPPGGGVQTSSGAYITQIPNAAGCDSTITTNLTVIPNTSSTANISICAGQSYTPPGGTAETTAGTYISHISNAAGCDSTITTNLTVIPNTSSTANISICAGQSYTPPGGTAQTIAGTYITHIANAQGCDSTITTNLSLISNSTSTVNVTICNGTSYTPPGGSALTIAGPYVTHITNSAGCDSAITTNLTVINSITTSATVFSCPGNAVNLPDNSVVHPVVSSDYISTVASIGVPGCDSIITTHVIINGTLNISATVTPIACFGSTASVSLSASGGTPPYVFSGSPTTNLTSGIYSYTVADSLGCFKNTTVTINPGPTQLSLTTTITQIRCYNAKGSVMLSCSGGVPPYSYSGDPTTNLSAGTYNYTVTDANGCNGLASAVINPAPAQLIVIATPTQIACYGGKGSVARSATGGTPPYTFSGAALVNLSAGTYTYNVVDSKGCTSSAQAIITPAPSRLMGISSSTKTKCNANTGTASISGSGGSAPYTFSWNTSPIQTTAQAVNLGAGTYQVTITDGHACTALVQVSVTMQSPTAITITGNSSVCPGGITSLCANSGFVSYLWDNGDTTRCTNVGSAGTYTVTGTNTYGCTSSASKTLTTGTIPVFSISGPGYICPGTTTSICAPAGFTTYRWSNNNASSCLSVATGGTYSVTVTNSGGCTSSASKTVTSPMVLTLTRVNGVCSNGFLGSANAAVTGSTGPYTYQWSNGETTSSISQLEAGTYTVTVTDAYGCTKTSSIVVSVTKAAADYSNISSFFLDTDIQPGSYLWFNNSVKVNYAGTYPVTIWFTNQTIQSSKFSLVPANGKLVLTNAVSQAVTTFNGTEWVTIAPPNPTGQYFISGYSHQVPALIPKNLNPVAWKGVWTASCPGLSSVDWKWSAAVYSNFTTSLDQLSIKSMDGNATTQFNNNDLAGSPENYLSYCVIGARGGGIPNYTGSYSGITHRNLCSPLICNPNSSVPPMRQAISMEIKENKEITYNAFPNPFSSSVTIEFERAEKSTNTTIEVFNLNGERVVSLFNENTDPGVKYSTVFNAESLSNGIYFYRIISGNDIINEKLILKK